MNIDKYKIQALLLFIASLLSMILMAVSFWNSLIKSNSSFNSLSIVFLFIAITCICALYYIFLTATHHKLWEKAIHEKVQEERIKILEDFNKKNTGEKQEIINDIDISDKMTRILPSGSYKSEEAYARKLLTNLAKEIDIVKGIIYLQDPRKKKLYHFLSGYALTPDKTLVDFSSGENLNGQVASTKEMMILTDIPDNYNIIESGLGYGKPCNLIIAPLINKSQCIGVLEVSTFYSMNNTLKELIAELTGKVADKLVRFKQA